MSSPPWSPYPVLKEDTILRTSPWLSPQLQKLLQSLFPFNLSLAHFCILFDRNCSKPPRNISLAVFHMRAACVLKCLLYNKNHVSREILTDRAVFSFFSIIKPHSYCTIVKSTTNRLVILWLTFLLTANDRLMILT